MDTGTHFRAIWSRRWPVLVTALLVGLLVLALRLSQAPTFTVEADLYLASGETGGSNALETERLTAFYAEIIRDERILADVVERAGPPLTAARVGDQVSVSSPGRGKLTVTARASTAGEAVLVADAAADALAEGARRDQAEALRQDIAPLAEELETVREQLAALPAGDPQAQELRDRRDRAAQARFDRLSRTRARLDVVRRAQLDDVVRTPRAERDALLAFLVALILAAEVAALLSGRRGGLDGRDPALTLEEWTSLPVFRLGSDGRKPDETAAALGFLRRVPGQAAYLAPLTPGPVTAAGTYAFLAAMTERSPRLVWADLADPPLQELDPLLAGVDVVRPSSRPRTLRGPQEVTTVVSAEVWSSARLLSLAETLPGTCALVVDPRTARKPEVLEAVRVLSFTDLPVRALLVVSGDPHRAVGSAARDEVVAAPVPAATRTVTSARRPIKGRPEA